MANIIYNYPKSSCPDSICNKNFVKTPDYNTYRIKQYNQTYDFNTHITLNSNVNNVKQLPDFVRKTLNNRTVYTSVDPRLLHVISSTTLELDRPPNDTSVKLSDIYNTDLRNYGKNYKSYNDINAGQIVYYINNSEDDPYYQNISTKNVKQTYDDPMESKYIEYSRVPIISRNPLTEDLNSSSGFGLTWIRDTIHNRENNMSYALSSLNKQSIIH